MNKTQKMVLIGGLGGALLITLFLMGQPKSGAGTDPDDTLAQTNTPSSLYAEETAYDFGSVSMANGTVSRTFRVKNEGAAPIEFARLTTSCMCTTATFIQEGSRLGPFGMPGHGFVPPLNATLEAGAEADVEVVFDPAAHGPAGIGRIERGVFLEPKNGAPLTLTITATVTP